LQRSAIPAFSNIIKAVWQKYKIKMLNKGESQQHRKIKLKLAQSFKDKGWSVKSIDGEGEQTNVVENDDIIGDGENKRPDVDAKHESAGRVIRGEAKIDDGDFDSEHSITQYKLFSNRSSNGVNSWLVLGVPFGTKKKIEAVLAKNLNSDSLGNIVVWEC
jgi:hypothetical protein